MTARAYEGIILGESVIERATWSWFDTLDVDHPRAYWLLWYGEFLGSGAVVHSWFSSSGPDGLDAGEFTATRHAGIEQDVGRTVSMQTRPSLLAVLRGRMTPEESEEAE